MWIISNSCGLHQGPQTRGPHVARDAFRELSNVFHLSYLVYSTVIKSALLESEQVPLK